MSFFSIVSRFSTAFPETAYSDRDHATGATHGRGGGPEGREGGWLANPNETRKVSFLAVAPK